MEFPRNWDEAGTKTVSRRSQRYNLTRLRWNMSHEAKLYFIVHCTLDGLHEISGCRFRYRRSWKKEINCYGEIRSIPKMWIFLPQWHIFTSSLLIVSFCSRWYERSWPFSAWEHENYTFVFTINVIIDERYCLDVDDFVRRDEWNSCWTKFELSKIFFPKKKKRKLKLNIRSKFDYQFHQKRNYPISPSWSNHNHRGWKG